MAKWNCAGKLEDVFPGEVKNTHHPLHYYAKALPVKTGENLVEKIRCIVQDEVSRREPKMWDSAHAKHVKTMDVARVNRAGKVAQELARKGHISMAKFMRQPD